MHLKTKLTCALGAAMTLSFAVNAEEPAPPFQPSLQITPVWEYLISGDSSPLPILKGEPLASSDGDTFDGTSEIDTYAGFRKYDETKALLGIRENGINETDPAHDADLAAMYPDRSLIWIDLATGAPMGLAIEVGFSPVPLDQDFLDAGGTVVDYYLNFGVSEDGVVYVGYKNKILRYAPDGADGFEAPTVAFTKANDQSERWGQWRWENIRVSGSGADTTILAGGKTWRPSMGYYYLVTADGLTYEETAYIPNGFANASGGASSLMPGRDPAFPDDMWAYVSSYPGSDNGQGTSFYRFVIAPFAGGVDVFKDPDFPGVQIPEEFVQAENYVGRFISDTDTNGDLDYMVAYSTPSWNSVAIGVDPWLPGYLALHNHDGELLATYTLNVTEDEELTGDVSNFHGTLGGVELIPTSDGAEILWYSGIYGYGKYTVGPVIPMAAWYFDGADELTPVGGSPALPAELPSLVEDNPMGAEGDFSLMFDGTQGAYYSDTAGMLNFDDSDFTLQAYVKFDTFTTPAKIIIASYGLPGGYSFWVTTERKVGATTYGLLDFFSEAVVPDDGGWHHIAMVHENGVEARFYVDGVLGDTIAYTSGVNTTADTNLYVGYETVSGDPMLNSFVGNIDRLIITGKALTPAELDFTATEVGPTLTAMLTAEGVVISWPVAEGFALETKMSPDDAEWTLVEGEVTVDAGTASIVVPATMSSQIFRAKK
jgi:hypothetical protein